MPVATLPDAYIYLVDTKRDFYPENVDRIVYLNAPVSRVWHTLTDLELIKQWLTDSDIALISDWQPGSRVKMEGRWHGIKFWGKGEVLRNEPERVLSFNYWSKFLKFPDHPDYYSIVTFSLMPEDDGTNLRLQHENFATYQYWGHAQFYWLLTLERLKKLVEG